MATEHHIQVAFRHFLKPGDVVFDVGANKGWLSAPLARLVGEDGVVVCFEPSPRNLGELRQVAEQYKQVQIVEKGVFSKSGETIRFFENAFSNADSIYFKGEGAVETEIETITLDDYVTATKLAPVLIKMDIEGAEYDALLGARRLIARWKPIIILELRETDVRPLEYLRGEGYVAVNLRTLERVEASEHAFAGALLEDVLFLPPTKAEANAGSLFIDAPRDDEALFAQRDGSIVLSAPVSLGVNIFRLWFDNVSSHLEYDVHVMQGERCIVYQRGLGSIVLHPFLSLVVPATELGAVDIVVAGPDSALELLTTRRSHSKFGDAQAKHVNLQRTDPFGIDSDVLLPHAEEAANRGQRERFETYVRHLKAATRESGRVHYLRGVSDLHADMFEEAVISFRAALKLGYDPHWSEYMAAVALDRGGDPAGARLAAEAALHAQPDSTFAQNLLAKLGT